MNKDIIIQLNKKFEEAAHQKNGLEYWLARDIQVLLDYSEWRNFLLVIEKAKIACTNSKQKITDHFVEVNKMVSLGSGSERQVDDMLLTRYACYLIAQNGDPRKEQIAFAQSYFAIQTRKQEILEERIARIERLRAREKLADTERKLSGIVYERGLDGEGFARLRSKGDQALFGGHTTLDTRKFLTSFGISSLLVGIFSSEEIYIISYTVKKRLNAPEKKPLADFLPKITIKAKDLAAEITGFNTKKNDLYGEKVITGEHVKNNKDVRNLLGRSGIKPELLPPEEDITKLKRRLKLEDKKLVRNIKMIKQ